MLFCLFSHREQTSKEGDHLLKLLLDSCYSNATATGPQEQSIVVLRSQISLRLFTKFTQFTKCGDLLSPISSGVLFTNLYCDSTSAPFTESPLLRYFSCTILQWIPVY